MGLRGVNMDGFEGTFDLRSAVCKILGYQCLYRAVCITYSVYQSIQRAVLLGENILCGFVFFLTLLIDLVSSSFPLTAAGKSALNPVLNIPRTEPVGDGDLSLGFERSVD